MDERNAVYTYNGINNGSALNKKKILEMLAGGSLTPWHVSLSISEAHMGAGFIRTWNRKLTRRKSVFYNLISKARPVTPAAFSSLEASQ